MSSLRFPAIETKKTLIEEEDYNFINKDKKKKTSTNNPLEIVEELKKKIDQQKKEIQNRNITIQGLQRNFQSLSVIVKTEKAQSAALRAELEAFKDNSESGDKRTLELHEKYIFLQRENKVLRQEVRGLKKAVNEGGQYELMNEDLKRRLAQLQETNEKLHGKIMQKQAEKKALQVELTQLRSLSKDHRILNQRLIDLQDQLKQLADSNNTLSLKIIYYQEELDKNKIEMTSRQKKCDDLRNKVKEVQKQKERCELQIDYWKGESVKLGRTIEQRQRSMENKSMYERLKEEQLLKLRRELQAKVLKLNEAESSNSRFCDQLAQKDNIISATTDKLAILQFEQQNIKQNFRNEAQRYVLEIQRLAKALQDFHSQLNLSTGQSQHLNQILGKEQQKSSNYQQKILDLHESIEEMNRKMQEHQQKYGYYLRLISDNQPDVIVTNQREMDRLDNHSTTNINTLHNQITTLQLHLAQLENTSQSQTINIHTMKKYIQSLQEEVTSKSQELIEKGRLLRKYQEEEDELNRMVETQRRKSEAFKRSAQEQILERMRELQYQKIKSRKEIEDEKQRLQEQLKQQRLTNQQRLKSEQQKSSKYTKLLEGYRSEEDKLRRMMADEQDELKRLSIQKQQEIRRIMREKEEEVERERKNNKLLWSDNKKLKELQNELREQSSRQMEEKEVLKRQELEKLKRQMERKYQEEMNSLKSEESNSNELKKILMERTSQHQSLADNFNKLKTQSQFYKNRNKELQALLSRVEKQFKDKTTELQRQNKSSKQAIDILDKKLKEGDAGYSELQSKQKRELKYLYDEIEEMKKQMKRQRVQQKISLVNKSISDLDTSLKTLMNTMSCNYCVQVVKECVRLQCGHIYCRKCKGGYEPNCGQCKKKGSVSNDKIIDESVSKAQYMRILINTIRDDLSKISEQ